MYICYSLYICSFFKKKKKKKKKKHLSFGLGKKLKSYATIVPLSIFSPGKGRESLYLEPYCKNFKNTQVRFPTDPYNTLV